MKIQVTNFTCRAQIFGARLCDPRSNFKYGRPVLGSKHSEGGMVTLVFIVLLAIMMILIMVESSSLIRMHREVKLLEQQQIKRLNGPQTNTIITTTTP